MAYPKSRPDLEKGKFANVNDEVAVRVTDAPIGFVTGLDFDRVDVAYPSLTLETYTYSLNSVTQAVLEVSYLDSSKKDIEYVRKL